MQALRKTKRKIKTLFLGGYLEIELGKRGQVFEEISGLLGAAAHFFLDEAVNIKLDSGVGVVIVDVRQSVDNFGVGRRSLAAIRRWSFQHQNIPVVSIRHGSWFCAAERE